jgi:tripartite-type tricarboxylate transporter receptor subunit TctC
MQKIVASIALAGATVIGAAPAKADWPEREITVMVPFSPGGGVDQLMLPLRQPLEEELGVNVLIDYRPGGGGQIGFQHVAAQGADGHVIGALVLPHLVGTQIYQDAAYSLDDFAPVAIISGDVPIWFSHPDAPFDDISELIEAARERPDEITVAIGSFTGEHYLTLVQIEEQADVSFRAVNVGGGAEVMSGVVGQHFDVGISRPASILPVQDDIKGLGIVASERNSLYPNTMTFEEQLGDEFEISRMQFAVGIMTSAAFAEENPEGFARLVEAVEAAVHSDAYIQSLETGGRELSYLGPDEASDLIAEMYEVMEQYRPMVEAAQQ